MSSPELLTFHVRMPKRLKDELQAAVDRGGKSLNDEVVKRLERTLGPDDALLRLAAILKPLMEGLSEEDQATLIAAARILAKDRRKQSRPRKRSGE